MITHLQCVETVIDNEIEQGCNQRSVALTYALALKSDWPTNWAHVNAAIRKRWPKGLSRVKKLAWRIFEHGPGVLEVDIKREVGT